MNLPIALREIKEKSVTHTILLVTSLQGAVGIVVLVCERWFLRR